MPELPEVETVVRLIRPHLVGRVIRSCDVRWERTLGGLGTADFCAAVVGARVVRVWRRAKFFVVELERAGRAAGALVGHLRMTGRVRVEPRDVDAGSYVKVSLALDDGRVMHFIDVRKFGRLSYVDDAQALLAQLGPEPLEREFTAQWLHAALRARQRVLKPLLLDQTFVAGLGNIYVDESLFAAGLHPLARSDRVSAARAAGLVDAIRGTLAAAIEREGSSFDVFYRTPEGNPGSYQEQFKVYGRAGEPCLVCGGAIARIVVAQRGTHVCRSCQRR